MRQEQASRLVIAVAVVGVLLALGSLGVGGVFLYRALSDAVSPISEEPRQKPAAPPDVRWERYQSETLAQWRERAEALDEDDRVILRTMEMDLAGDPTRDERLADFVERRRCDALVDAYLKHAFGPAPDLESVGAADAALTADDLQEFRAWHGAFIESHPPRTSTGARWRDGRVRMKLEFVAWFASGLCEAQVWLVWAPESDWRIHDLAVTERPVRAGDPRPSSGPTVPVPGGETAGDKLVRQTCASCGAIRFGHTGESWEIAKGRAGRDDCPHLWKMHASNGVPGDLRDGRVVLVRNATQIGAFMLRGQSIEPEHTSVDWVIRDNDGGSLDPMSVGVESGSAEDVRSIKFGTLRVNWSGGAAGSGHIYYGAHAGVRTHSNSTRICVTSATSFQGLDPYDPQWHYRASASDEGIRGR